MDRAARACILFLTFVVAAWVLYWLRDILAPFALAIFFWLIIDAFARWLDSKISFLPYPRYIGHCGFDRGGCDCWDWGDYRRYCPRCGS